MAYEEVTSPILTDATGQEIVDQLEAIAQNLQPPTNIEASDVNYDNTQSGMTATDVQEAVDELKSNLIKTTISNKFFYGIYPNGKLYNTQKPTLTVTIPIKESGTPTVTIIDCYVYDTSGNFTQITATVVDINDFGFSFEMPWTASYAGRQLRLSYSVSYS